MQQEQPLPSAQEERYEVVDVLRGIALFGILLVNIGQIHSPTMYAQMLGTELWTAPFDRFVQLATAVLAQGKFYPIFSFLFGMGFVMFVQRAQAKGGNGRALHLKRMVILLGFGLLHLLFVWWGDILTSYALIGMLLLFFYPCRPNTLLVWAFSLLSVLAVLTVLSVLLALAAGETGESGWVYETYERMMDMSYAAYGSGSYSDAFVQRLADLAFLSASTILSSLFIVLPMFLFGMYTARQGWLFDLPNRMRVVTRIGWGGLIIGAPLTGIKIWSESAIDPASVSVYDLLGIVGMLGGDIGLSLFYISLAVRLYERLSGWKGWSVLARTGRMALTNYLTQTVVLTTLFYGYGLGLYGRVGPAAALLLVFILFSLQLWASAWWMRRHRHGPLEWLWRRLTYGSALKRQRDQRE